MRRGMLVLLAALLAVPLGFAAGAGGIAPDPCPPVSLDDLPGFTPLTWKDLPDFAADVERKVTKSGKVHTHGLVSTINFEQFRERSPAGLHALVLERQRTGFRGDLTVQCAWQEHKAPLAVMLVGFGARATDKLPRACLHDLHAAGCHAIAFDSVIRNDMNEQLGHGVAGNVFVEAKVVARIVDTLLAYKPRAGGPPLREQVSGVRLLGTSYGGLLALQVLREPQAREWPIDRVLAVSSPLNMKSAERRLDAFWTEDRPFFFHSLLKLLGGYTPQGETPTEREESLMRAGIGHVFHGDLSLYAQSNVARYMPDLVKELKHIEELPAEKQKRREAEAKLKAKHEQELKVLENLRALDSRAYKEKKKDVDSRQKIERQMLERRVSDPAQWSFHNYSELLLRRHWNVKSGLVAPVKLTTLMEGAPNFVQVVISADDPLNDPRELADLRPRLQEPAWLILPHGGHLGQTGTAWMQAMVKAFFKP